YECAWHRPFTPSYHFSSSFCTYQLFNLFFFDVAATTEIYTLSLHDALPICSGKARARCSRVRQDCGARRSSVSRRRPSRACCWRSEEHTSELQSLAYLVCRLLLEKKNINLDYDVLIEHHGAAVLADHDEHGH